MNTILAPENPDRMRRRPPLLLHIDSTIPRPLESGRRSERTPAIETDMIEKNTFQRAAFEADAIRMAGGRRSSWAIGS